MLIHLEMTGCHIPYLGQCDLDSDLVLRIIVSGAYLLYFLSEEIQIWSVDASWDSGVSCTVFGSL